MSLLQGACFSLLVIIQALGGVSCLTNLEFFDSVKKYATELQIEDIEDVISPYDVNNDVIELPGGPEDDVNLLHLFSSMGFAIKEVYPDKSEYVSQDDYGQLLGGCSCRGLTCRCCGSHRFSARVVFKKIKFTLNGCMEVIYLPANRGFRVKLTLNGRQFYNKEISLINPPAICHDMPALEGFAKVCLKLYSVNLGSRIGCAKLEGVLDLKVTRFRVSIGLGCFHFPLAERDEQNRMKHVEMLQTHEEGQQLYSYVEDDETLAID